MTQADPFKENIAETFMKFAKMNPIERIRAAYLKDHDLTEESLASLPKEERDAIEKEIQEMIKKKLGDDRPNKMGSTSTVGLNIVV